MAKTRKIKKMQKAWGYHLIVNAADCDPQALRSAETIKKFTKALVKKIKMVAYGPPKVVRFGSGKQMGYSLVQLIETSNITAHFAEETNDIYLDIFSCAPYEAADALSVIRDFFSPKKMETKFFNRQAPKH